MGWASPFGTFSSHLVILVHDKVAIVYAYGLVHFRIDIDGRFYHMEC